MKIVKTSFLIILILVVGLYAAQDSHRIDVITDQNNNLRSIKDPFDDKKINKPIADKHAQSSRSVIDDPLAFLSKQKIEDSRKAFIWPVTVEKGYIRGTYPPATGDWIINDTTIVENSVIIINGSIIVEKSGELVLINSSLYMNLSSDAEHWIDIYGGLEVINSTITAYNTEYNYFIRAKPGSRVFIDSSEISYAGDAFPGEYSSYEGLWISTNNATIKNSFFHENYYGLILYEAENVRVYNNTFANNTNGLQITKTNYSEFLGNEFLGEGVITYLSYNNTFSGNTVNGKPLIYLEGRKNVRVSDPAGEIIIVKSENIYITGQNLSSGRVGIEIAESNQCVLRNNMINGNFFGVFLFETKTVYIYNNTITGNNMGIFIMFSNDTAIRNNVIMDNNFIGISIMNSLTGLITNNFIIKSNVGISLESSNGWRVYRNRIEKHRLAGIQIRGSEDNMINYNTIRSNSFGLNIISSRLMMIYGNTIENNSLGIELRDSSSVRVIFNNFIDNNVNADGYRSNIWSTIDKIKYTYNGKTYYKKLGNYWGNLTGEDNDGDGLRDSPYGNDQSPLIEPTWKYEINDEDNDKLNDIEELDIYGTNATNPDSDGDKIPDWWEIEQATNPLLSYDASRDMDNDSLTNLQEYKANTDPRNPDTDNDGYSDGYEIKNGTSPLDPDDYPGKSRPNQQTNEGDTGEEPNQQSNIFWEQYYIAAASVIVMTTILSYMLYRRRIK